MTNKQLMPRRSEHEEAVALMEYARVSKHRKALAWLYHQDNGRSTAGQGARKKGEGIIPGVADYFLPQPLWRNGLMVSAGLFIELKAIGGRLTSPQLTFLEAMRSLGYEAEVCYGAEEAILCLEAYLEHRLVRKPLKTKR